MSKSAEVGGIVSPASLWGKPLPKTLHKTAPETKKDTGMLPEDEDLVMEEDVDAELEADGPSDAELEAEDPAVDETNTDEEVGDDDDEPSYDDEEDADEDEEEDSDTSAVEDAKKKVSTKRVTTPMAGKKKSMSDHVREEIDRRKASGDSLRGVDIVNTLAKKGIKVSAAQVSQLLKKADVSAKARNPRKSKAAAEERSRLATSTRKVPEPTTRLAAAGKPTTGGITGLQVTHLKAAKDFVAACGNSYDEAFSVLDMHRQLHEVL